MNQLSTKGVTYFLAYNDAYQPIYDPAYNMGFVFYDEEELEDDEAFLLLASSFPQNACILHNRLKLGKKQSK
jgi:hypothetical protein